MDKNKAENKVNSTNPFPKMEEEVLEFWDKGKIFEKSVATPPTPLLSKGSVTKDYVFYDGPPFGTGEPHYGHLLSSIAKDVVPRYWTMKGYRVERRWGWDCHGLPIENIIEKDLGISGKKEIEKLGIAKFNEACRARVLEYADIWDVMIRRIGRWVDFKNSYKTMDLTFMESVWWAFKQLWQKDLVYEGRKVLLYCPRCETPISNFEVAMDNSYQDITEASVYVKFKLKYRNGKTGRGVGALILNDKNEVLLIKRNEKSRRITWALPGGKVEAGEKFVNALRREVTEELGVKVVEAIPFSGLPDILEGRLFETICYKVRLEGEPQIMVPLEIEKLAWFPLDDMPEIDYPPSRDAINIYKEQKQKFFIDEDINRPLSNVNMLAWTTTPWTLPGNVALAVGSDITYAMIKINNDFYVVAKDRLEVIKEKYETVKEFKGKELVGLEYEPLFAVPAIKESGKRVHYVADADFVTADDGTGVVHTAVVYGEDDYNLGLKLDLPVVPALDEKGFFNETVPQFKGVYFKEADKLIIADLDKRKLLFATENITHSYPHCWRCETQLFYNAIPALFLAIGKIRKRMLELNERINWFPSHLKYGRFALGIEQAPDWNISRNRYFATPIPIWECDKCNEKQIIGSIKELEDLSGWKGIGDIHSHFIDDITWTCTKCGGKMHRTKEVFDCWVESGSMSFAQMHYPFENKEKFEKNFPAQYISEYISQTRAWFYVMHVMSTALFDSNSFENVVATGVILNEKGEKMSKSKKNFPDPIKVINEFGADALRFYLMSSSLMEAENLFFNERELRDIFRKNIMILWNVFKFYEMYSNNSKLTFVPSSGRGKTQNSKLVIKKESILDKWILARLNQLINEVTDNMDKYDLVKATRPITDFINDLSTWYLRRSRDRFKNDTSASLAQVKDKEAALQTTDYVLTELAKVLAPFMPFLAEQIWQKVTGFDFKDENKSVHLESWPDRGSQIVDRGSQILEEMEMVRKIVELGLAERDKVGIKVRQPLSKLKVKSEKLKVGDEFINLIADEVNVKKVEFIEEGELAVELDTTIDEELKLEGLKRELVRMINSLRKEAGLTIQDKINLYWQSDSELIKNVFESLGKDILKDTLADKISETAIEEQKEFKINGEQVKLSVKKL